jgi:predicted oxidoreductase
LYVQPNPDRVNIRLDKDSQELTIEFNLGTSSKWFLEAQKIFDADRLTVKTNNAASSSTAASYAYKVTSKAGPIKVNNFLDKITEDNQNPHLNRGERQGQSQMQQVKENLVAVKAKIDYGKNIDTGSSSTTGFGAGGKSYGSYK